MKILQTLAENLEVKRLGLKKENKKLTSKNNRPRMIRQIVNSDMREKLKELVKKEDILEKTSKRIGTFKILMMLAEKIGLTKEEVEIRQAKYGKNKIILPKTFLINRLLPKLYLNISLKGIKLELDQPTS